MLLLSAIPGAIIGALFTSVIEDELGDPILIGINLIVFGLVLEWADGRAGHAPTVDFHRRDAVIMGVAQALALAPGVSRSGVTISAGRWLRFDRESATRLSFLMSIPITGGAALYKGVEMFAQGDGIPPGSAARSSGAWSSSGVSGFIADRVPAAVRAHALVPPVRDLPRRRSGSR